MSNHQGITVTGSGEATAPPDLATVNVGVSVLSPTVAEATDSAATAANSLIDALTSEGVERSDIGTASYSITSEHDWSGNTRRLLGYRVNNTVMAKVRDLDRVGTILDRAVSAAGDAATVNNLQFSIEDPTDQERKARDLGWADALAIAEQLAGLAGRELGRATTIMETTSTGIPFPTPRGRMDMMASAESSTPIEAGTTTVTVRIEVRFDFAD